VKRGLEHSTLLKTAPWRADSATLQALAGTSRLTELGMCLGLAVDGDGLRLTDVGGTALLKPLSPGALVDTDSDAAAWLTRLDVASTANGPVAVRVSGDGLVGMLLERADCELPTHLQTTLSLQRKG
jgi:hypothetical protein